MKAKDWDDLSEDYHDVVISPFQEGVINPMFRHLENIEDPKTKVIADIGCGRGEIGKKLCSMFKEVYMLDFSPGMIEVAKSNSKSTKPDNMNFMVKDMRDLSEFNEKFDVVIAVNSVIMPCIADVKKSLKSIYDTLKPGGNMYGIFPSMSSIAYQAFLALDNELSKGKDEKMAVANAKRLIERRKYNFVKGTYNDDGQEQKFYWWFELKIRLQEAGFKDIKMSKVLYPWGEQTGDFLDFPGRPKMWDWFISAKK